MKTGFFRHKTTAPKEQMIRTQTIYCRMDNGHVIEITFQGDSLDVALEKPGDLILEGIEKTTTRIKAL